MCLCVAHLHSGGKICRNTMAFDSRQVHVSGVPTKMCEVYLQLLFESRRFCPLGGPVEKVDLNLQTRTAVVTFSDAKGIFVMFFIL